MNKRITIIISSIIVLLLVMIIVIVIMASGKGSSDSPNMTDSTGAVSDTSNTAPSEYRIPLGSDDIIDVTPTPSSGSSSQPVASDQSASTDSSLPEGSDGTSGGTGGTGEDVTATPTPTPAPTPKPAGPTRDPYEGEPYTDF